MTLWFRRVAGLMLVLLATIPLYRWLPLRETGLAGRSTAETVTLQADLLWSGFLLLGIVAFVAGLLVPPARMRQVEAFIARVVAGPSLTAFVLGVAILAIVLTTLAALLVFERRPNLVDALLQLTHARYFAEGRLGGPMDFAAGFWHMQNALVTSAGWFSQYPPGHIAVLALGYAAGAPWLVGPLLMGGTAALTVLVMARLVPERPVTARLAGLAVAASPFLMAHSASFMNHSTAALLGVLAVYCGVRAAESSSPAWAALTGAVVAAGSLVRPLAAIVTMLVVIATWAALAGGPLVRRLRRPGIWAAMGGAPFVAAHLWYNRAAFGSSTTFGYDAVWGPSHGLGFHRDPWGNVYGPIEALLYTSADLTALNLNLLETLLPHVVLVGVFLLVARRLSAGERILTLWALLPVVANAGYWHHGQFMGPRMLAEFAPAWTGLALVAAARLLAMIPDAAVIGSRLSPRVAASALGIAGAVAMLVMAPQRLWSYGGDWLPGFRAAAPAAPANAIVFVHGAWETRLMSRLASGGLRLDRVETAMRENPTCLVEQHLAAMPGGAMADFGTARNGLAPLDLTPDAREYQPRLLVARDARVRVDTTVAMATACLAQIGADRFGAVDASFFMWLGDLPGLERGAPLFARDLGPALNAQLLARHPERSAWMYGYFAAGDSLRLLPYGQASAILWGTQ